MPIHEDIHDLKYGEPVDIVTAGFPCQPFSTAGERRGAEDDRSLWPEMLRVVAEVRPTWGIFENVAGFKGMGLRDLVSALGAIGYGTVVFCIPACAVGLTHRRDRLWICAYANDDRELLQPLDAEVAELPRIQETDRESDPGDIRGADGLPTRLDRLRGLGNAIVPGIAERIFRAIENVPGAGRD